MGASNVLLDRLGGCVLAEGIAHLLGAVVGDFDTDVCLICREGLTESFLLAGGELACVKRAKDCGPSRGSHPCVRGAQGVLLDAATHLPWSVASERDDVKGVEHAGCALGAGQAMAFLLSPPWRGLESQSGYRSELFAALGQPVLMRGARPSRDQIHSSGPWDDPTREWSTMPVNSRGPRRRRSW